MFHHDIQTQNANNWKRHANEHPINRILTTYFNADKHNIKASQSNVASNHQKSETNHIMQRQRVIRSFLNKPDETESLIRKPVSPNGRYKNSPTTSISSPHVLFAELNEHSITTTNNNHHYYYYQRPQILKKESERHSPILSRRQRNIENLSIQERSDIANVYGNYQSSPSPPNFSLRNNVSNSFLLDRSSLKINSRISTPNLKPLHYSKTISENTLKQNAFNMKGIHPTNFLPIHRWTPILSEPGTIQNRTANGFSRSKSYLSKYSIKRHFQASTSDKLNPITKMSNIQSLYISPRSSPRSRHESESNKKRRRNKAMSDEYEDSKWGHASDEDESISADGNSSTSTGTSHFSLTQYDSAPSSIILSNEHDLSFCSNLPTDNSNSLVQRPSSKRSLSRRRTYNIALPPVAESAHDEDADMKNILEKLYSLQNNILNEKIIQPSMDDEQSLTFQILNQQETDFEKKLSKSKQYK